MTTNHYGATGDGLILGYRAGVPLRFLHTVQYHPTGAVFPEQAEGLLITEKFRGAGANVLNIDGEQFVYEREPRDVESAAFIRECLERGKGVPTPTGKFGVWLDSPMIDVLKGEGTVRKEFPGKWILFHRYGIDITKEPMLVYPDAPLPERRTGDQQPDRDRRPRPVRGRRGQRRRSTARTA